MRIEKTFRYCDRCNQEMKDDSDDKRVGRMIEIYKKTTTECKIIVYKNADSRERRQGYDLCEDCRLQLERWLNRRPSDD